MTDAEAVQRQLAAVTRSRSEAGVFVRMDGRLAVVNIGTSTVTVPCVGFYPPVVGMTVRVDWVNGSPAVTGPVRPLSPLGTITATGNPRATVSVDGDVYSLFYRDGYTPVVNDPVEINWATGIIQGKVTGVENPDSPGESGGAGSTPFTIIVRAAGSGRYQPGSGWWGTDLWASSSNDSIWVYGDRVRDALGAATVTGISVYMPLISEVGQASVGVHPYHSIPGGAPAVTSLIPMDLEQRNGWVTLPVSFGVYLQNGGRGIGVVAPDGNGYTRWTGTASDPLSGALQLSGTH